MKRKFLFYLSRFSALFLSLTLLLPPPALALRAPQFVAQTQAGNEELADSLRSPLAPSLATGVEERLIEEAQAVLAAYQYRPITGPGAYGPPVIYQEDPETWPIIFGLVDSVQAAATPGLRERIQERVRDNPAALAHVVSIYKHSPYMMGKMKPGSEGKPVPDPDAQAEVAKTLIRQLATDDAVLRFIENDPDLQASYKFFLKNPSAFAQAVLVYEEFKDLGSSPQPETVNVFKGSLARLASGRLLPPETISRILGGLRPQGATLPEGVRVGEATFFRALLDKETLSPVPYIVEAFRKGFNHLEIPLDRLPFDPAKLQPGAIPSEWPALVKAVAELFEITLTNHSGIVGDQHPKTKFIATSEDPADNVGPMKQMLDTAEEEGSRGVVFHISDRQSEDAINRYVEITLHAVGKKASDGSPLKVQWENYLHKNIPGKGRFFPTVDEHFAVFAEIVKRAARKNPDVLRHVSLLLDSAHLNLVPGLQDPIVGTAQLHRLARDLAYALRSELRQIGLSQEEFLRRLVTETHNNENAGPGLEPFLGPGDYGSDVHARVSAKGTVPIRLFLAMLNDLGFTERIDLAEQKDPANKADRALIAEANFPPRDPGLKPGEDVFDFFVAKGRKIVEAALSGEADNQGPLHKVVAKHFNPTSEEAYYWVAGRFGIPALLEHLGSREHHEALDGDRLRRKKDQPVLEEVENKLDDLPVIQFGVETREVPAGQIIVREGDRLEDLRRGGANSYFTIFSGEVKVTQEIPVNGGFRTVEVATLKQNDTFGGAIFLSALQGDANPARNATVTASKDTVLYVFPEDQFLVWMSYDPLRERVLRIWNERLKANERKRRELEQAAAQQMAAGTEERFRVARQVFGRFLSDTDIKDALAILKVTYSSTQAISLGELFDQEFHPARLREAGFELGLAQLLPLGLWAGDVDLAEAKAADPILVHIEQGRGWTPDAEQNLLTAQELGLVKLVDLASAQIVVAETDIRSDKKQQVLAQVSSRDYSTISVTYQLLRHIMQNLRKDLLKSGGILLLHRGDSGEDLFLFA